MSYQIEQEQFVCVTARSFPFGAQLARQPPSLLTENIVK